LWLIRNQRVWLQKITTQRVKRNEIKFIKIKCVVYSVQRIVLESRCMRAGVRRTQNR
jgi:hypothetical protein